MTIDIDRSMLNIKNACSTVVDNVAQSVLARSSARVPQLQTRIQTLFNLKFKSPGDSSIYDVILEHATAAEKLGPGGFDMCIENVLSGITMFEDGRHLPNAKDILRDILGAGAAHAKLTDVQWVIDKQSLHMTPEMKELLLQALSLAGFAGRIIVEKSRSRVSSVELVKGYTFETSPAWPLNAKLDKPRIVCIDGFIENVSEIHHLLESSSEAKEPVLVFVRGLHDDVKHTLKVNFDRGSLVVIPVLVPFDLSGMNTLKDVAVSCSCRLVSSLSGELISSVRYSDLSSIDLATVYPDKVVMMNKRSQRSVAIHVKDLRSRREEQGLVGDVAKLLDDRIRALSPNHVVIRLPDDKDFVIKSQAIDYVLRSLKSLIDHGTVTFNGTKHLTSTVIASVVHSQGCLETLRNLGAVLA